MVVNFRTWELVEVRASWSGHLGKKSMSAVNLLDLCWVLLTVVYFTVIELNLGF